MNSIDLAYSLKQEKELEHIQKSLLSMGKYWLLTLTIFALRVKKKKKKKEE